MPQKLNGRDIPSANTPIQPPAVGVFGDNFVRANSATVGLNWTDVQTGVYSISSNFLTLTNSAPNGTAYQRDYLIRQSSENAQDQRAEIVFAHSAAGNDSIGLVMRYQTGTKNHYNISISGLNGLNVTVAIYSIVGGTPSTILAPTAANINAPSFANRRCRIVAECIGVSPTTINVWVYDEATGGLLHKSTHTDSTASLQASGATGINAWNLSANPSIESFQSMTVPSKKYNLICEGDSITRGDQASYGQGYMYGCPYPGRALSELGLLWQGNNLGISGQNISTMAANAATRASANFVNGLTNVVSIMGGTNDMGTGGRTPAQCFADLTTTANAWRAAGYKVVVCTICPASHPVYASTFNANRATYNALIINGWKGIADAVCDIGGHHQMGQNGSDCNRYLYYSADRTHPVDAGNAIMGSMLAETIRQLNI